MRVDRPLVLSTESRNPGALRKQLILLRFIVRDDILTLLERVYSGKRLGSRILATYYYMYLISCGSWN